MKIEITNHIRFKQKHIKKYEHHESLPYAIEIDGELYTPEECIGKFEDEIEHYKLKYVYYSEGEETKAMKEIGEWELWDNEKRIFGKEIKEKESSKTYYIENLNKKQKDLFKTILQDLKTLIIELKKDDNKYYCDLIKENIKDLFDDNLNILDKLEDGE